MSESGYTPTFLRDTSSWSIVNSSAEKVQQSKGHGDGRVATGLRESPTVLKFPRNSETSWAGF